MRYLLDMKINQMTRRQTPIKSVLIIAALGVWGTTVPAFAFTPGACRQDAQRLCPGKTGKEMVPCLKQHSAELSTACQVNLAETRERVRQAKDACEEDQKKWCSAVEPGKGRVVECLKTHASELSTGCKEKLAAIANTLSAGAQAQIPAASTTTPSVTP